MRKQVLSILLLLFSTIGISQIPKGRYFDNIKGTTWQSVDLIDHSGILNSKRFELFIFEEEIDSIQKNTILWSFEDSLKIASYNSVTKQKQVILMCAYQNDHAEKVLTLFIDNRVLKFEYLSAAMGNCISFARKKGNIFFEIPESTFDYLAELEYDSGDFVTTVPSFEISKFITYGEYKMYLESVKKDSSIVFYNSQLPDSNIHTKEVRKRYIESEKFDKYPVIGISWESAMNFCKWKTLKDNQKDSLEFFYRLPLRIEWVAANRLLGKDSDLNHFLCDWLLNIKDESQLDFSFVENKNISFSKLDAISMWEFSYFPSKEEPRVFHRKAVIGKSFLFRFEKLNDYRGLSHHADEGYRYVGFRMVKEYKRKLTNYTLTNQWDKVVKYWELEKYNQFKSL